MDQQEMISRLEERARNVGLPMYEVCNRAAVHPTTFSRWKLSERNQNPVGLRLETFVRLEAAVADEEAAQSSRQQRLAS